MNKKLSIILAVIFFINLIFPLVFQKTVYAGSSIEYYKGLEPDNELFIPANVLATSTKGRPFNDKYWLKSEYRVIVYGNAEDVPGNETKTSPIYGTPELRYLGFDSADNPFSNNRFPDDATSGKAMADKNWIKEPWDVVPNIEPTDYSNDDKFAPYIDAMVKELGWSPGGEGTFYKYGVVQSPPTLLARGSFRMWQEAANGKIWYDTQYIPKQTDKLETQFEVKTEILSNDFTIDADQNSVDVQVKVTAHLKDEAYMNDLVQKAIHYNRDDIKTWYLKVKYKTDKEVWIELKPNGSNTVTNTFTIPASRNLVTDKERVTFTGIGRVVFQNDASYLDSDSQDRVFTVIPNVVPLAPDLTIKAPEKANVQENYTVELVPIIPPGESLKSASLESSFNGGAYAPVSLSSLKATQNYPSVGTVNYRATATLSNGKSATAAAVTQIVDERSASAKADVFLPEKETYEGHYITAINRNKFYFDGKTYGPQAAHDLGLGESEFYVYDSSQYDLDTGLYDTANVDDNDSMDVRFNEPGKYKIGLAAIPTRGEEDEDVEAVIVKPTPDIIAYLLGSRKDDRKLTLDFSQTVINPDYPLVGSKTYVVIEDINSGEKVTVTNSSNPDSANIKTRALSGNVLDFLIKAPAQKSFRATIYGEDTRGKNDTETIDFTVNPDLPPVAEATASLVQYRDSSGTAKVRIGKSGKSNDGDELKVNNLKYKVDTDNDGSFEDETMYSLSSSLKDLEAIITTDKVGRILLDYTVQEDLTPDMLPEFVSAGDYLSDHQTKVIDVDNLQPHTALRAISSLDMDMLLVGNDTDIATLQTKTDGLKSALNSLETPVDLQNTVKGANISSNLVEQNITIQTAETISQMFGSTSSAYAYSTNLVNGTSNVYIRDFKAGNVLKKLSFSSTGDYNAIADGEWIYIIYKGGGTSYYFYNSETGVSLTGTLADAFSPYYLKYDEKLQLARINGSRYFDATTKNFFNMPSSTVYRNGNKLYYATRDASSGYGSYSILSLDLETLVTKTEKTFTSPDITQYGQNFNVDDSKIVFSEYSRTYVNGTDKFYFSLTLVDLKTVSIQYYNKVLFNSQYYGLNWGPAWQGKGKSFAYDAVNKILYGYMEVVFIDGKSGAYYFQDVLVKMNLATGELKRSIINEVLSYEYTHDLDSRMVFTDNNYLMMYRFNYGAGSFTILNPTSFAQVTTFSSDEKNPYYSDLATIYSKYLDGSFYDYYYMFSGRDKETFNHRHTANSAVELLSTSSANTLRLKSVDVNGKTYYVVQENANSFYTRETYIIDTSDNDRVYKSGIWDGSEYDAVVVVKGGKLWIFTDYRMGYFDTVTKTFTPMTDILDPAKIIYDIYSNFAVAKTQNYIHIFDRSQRIAIFEFPDLFKDKIIKYINDYTPRDTSNKYLAVMTEKAITLNASDITDISNAIKAKGLKLVWAGKTANQAAGQAIASQTGGVYMTYTDYDNAFSQLQTYLINNAPPKNNYYVMNVKKGEKITYDKYFFDLEKDAQIPSTTRWMYRHVPSTDGKANFSDQWLSGPVTSFDKSGVYYVSWDVQDNPKPANTDGNFAPYRKYAVREELMIIVGDAEPPAVQVINPTLSLRMGGSLKQNRKVTADLEVTLGTEAINYAQTTWTVTPVSGGTAADIKIKTISDISRQLLFKQPGRYHIKATIKDVKGSSFSTETDLDIIEDLPIEGTMTVSPNPTYRDAEGKAVTTITVDVTSPDDFIDSLNYSLLYDSNNDGSFDDETPRELPQYDNLTTFELNIDNGVGNYKVLASTKEGWLEDTIPEFVTEDDYSQLDLAGNTVEGNIAPLYDIRPEKDVYLVGEQIRYTSGFYMNYLNGDMSKGYFDSESDPMIDFKATYIQDKSAMPSQDATSAYHNVVLDSLVNSLDRAGLYTIQTNAWDDPKAGDTRFNFFRAESNTSENIIIVHRPPVAAASFTGAHDTADTFSFGNNMYLEGTRLRIYDASYDPDGYAVNTILSYKTGSGGYQVINSGDAITLDYGSIITVKAGTTDNWGASDTALYTITVVNDLDMMPEIIPSPVPASEEITARLITNQYALSARVVLFGISYDLNLTSSTASEKVWETSYTIPAARIDGIYNAEFYAISEGLAELRKDKAFQVDTPIDLVPAMPDFLMNGTGTTVKASTSRYVSATTVQLLIGTAYETPVLSMTDSRTGSSKSWAAGWTVPEGIPPGDYIARFTAKTPSGKTQTEDVAFRIDNLRITNVAISGYWNHWRGQTDIFGKQMTNEPHRFMSLETVKIDVDVSGYADKLEIHFSPELEAMEYTDPDGNRYDYYLDYGLPYVDFPAVISLDPGLQDNQAHWEYTLPLAPSSVGWDDVRRRPRYSMTVTAWKGDDSVSYTVDDIDITGNVYDQTYIQPLN